jgi:hypothetical protein
MTTEPDGKAEKEMPISNTPAVERIARVIAGRILSINAEGGDSSAGDLVDETWRNYREDALSILRTLREPDGAMADAGDSEMWERMVMAAIRAEEAPA